HALVIAIGLGLAFTLAMLAGGRALYAVMGGRDGSLDAALTYSHIIFAGIVFVWIFNSLANVLRATGNTVTPAVVSCVGAAVVVPLSPLLIFGFGPIPRLGVAGGAIATVAYFAV